jgi:hypothetical protein
VSDIAERTRDFSFAYLKELFVSATMRWINVGEGGAMDTIMAEQVDVLREQMASAISYDASSRQEMDEGMRGMPQGSIGRKSTLGRGVVLLQQFRGRLCLGDDHWGRWRFCGLRRRRGIGWKKVG